MRGIETDFDGLRYRSRLEAQWACMFTMLGWRFEYEPLDLDGYIPDFVLIFPKRKVLVEVKPGLDMVECEVKAKKLAETRTPYERVVLGAAIQLSADRLDNALRLEPFDDDRCEVTPEERERGYWSVGLAIARCGTCRQWNLLDHVGGWDCVHCEATSEDAAGDAWGDDRFAELEALWKRAKTITRWLPREA